MRTKKREKRILNLWDVKPNRAAEWETTPEGKVVVLVPKFRHPLLAGWLMPRLAKRFFRIKLDDVGSAIWQRCDGVTPVSTIAEDLKMKFGASVEPVEERIGKFLRRLEDGDLISIDAAHQSTMK